MHDELVSDLDHYAPPILTILRRSDILREHSVQVALLGLAGFLQQIAQNPFALAIFLRFACDLRVISLRYSV
jgi:hypothetical protein